VEGKPGNPLKLALDLDLQKLAYSKLASRAGAAFVLNIKTGEILTAVSTPSFDTNLFAFGITQNQLNNLLRNERKPMVNKFLSAQYPPGSVIKPVVALCALDN
jgi:penicillin-binding protein 2